MTQQGKVYLVGAGPGDPGLLTLKALQCLQKADVVIYDRLLHKSITDMAPVGAEKLYVGKSPWLHTREQDDINKLLVQKALSGKTVVRLKGGDPFMFGRGGEEAEILAENGIPFEIVPGVTSAIAVPAYAGIPVTHRGTSSSFAVITGHEDVLKEKSSIRWDRLAGAVDTLIFLMGMHNIASIVQNLVQNGLSKNTPVAVIQDGTTPLQKTVTGTLADIVSKVEQYGIIPPAVIVIGEVVRLREKMVWFESHPLFGKKVLVTRPAHQANSLSSLLEERGAQVIELPAIKIAPALTIRKLKTLLADLTKYQWLVFTSANGVNIFFNSLNSLKYDARMLHNLKIAVIGPATAEALQQKGIQADFCPSTYSSRGIINGFKRRQIKGRRFLLLRADIGDDELSKGLSRLGAEVEEVIIYHTRIQKDARSKLREMLEKEEIDVITFTSPSTVKSLGPVIANSKKKNEITIGCIGPVTAAAVKKLGLNAHVIASQHTVHGLVRALEKYYEEVNL